MNETADSANMAGIEWATRTRFWHDEVAALAHRSLPGITFTNKK